MSIRKANQFYQELTPQQKHFVDNKTINTTLSIKHWIAFLAKASAFDEYCDKARQTLTVRITLLVLAVIGTIILSIALEVYYLLALPAVLSILLFNAVQTRRHFVSRDINNYLRLFFMPFLETMRQKAGEDAKLSASLDFRDPFTALTPEKYDYRYSGRTRNVKQYEPKMIIAGVTLSDGSYLETVLVDEIRSISYTNANGKSKSKTKTQHKLFIRLSASKKVYRRKSVPLPENIEMNEDADQFVFKLKDKHKEATYGVLSPALYFGALGSLYHLIEPARGGSAESISTQQAAPGMETTSDITGSQLMEALVWDDVIFSNYEYDSASRRGLGLRGTGDESRNIFDS